MEKRKLKYENYLAYLYWFLVHQLAIGVSHFAMIRRSPVTLTT